jgi:methionine-rich copper-binding protein CopC
MIVKRRIAAGMLLLAAAWASSPAAADEVHVMDSGPKASAVIDGRTSGFFVRFDRPVDHIRSTLAITQDGKLIERLTPRLESAPEVLFARAPTLSPGNYLLHWEVVTVAGQEKAHGDIPFSVAAQQ